MPHLTLVLMVARLLATPQNMSDVADCYLCILNIPGCFSTTYLISTLRIMKNNIKDRKADMKQ
jgi:hypothetical protein